jgi:hypothetical protein
MHLVYVDESGDTGLTNSPTREYLLVAIMVPEDSWHNILARINRARRRMKDKLGLDFAAEIHAAEFLGGAHIYLGLEAWQRVRAIRWLLKELSREPKLEFLAIGRDKQSGGEILRPAWARLVVEAENRTPERIMLLTDVTDRKAVLKAVHLREEDDGPNAQGPSERLIEDPIHIDSRHSRFIQISDLIAYLLRQSLQPNAHFRNEQPRQLVRMAIRLTGGIIWA